MFLKQKACQQTHLQEEKGENRKLSDHTKNQ